LGQSGVAPGGMPVPAISVKTPDALGVISPNDGFRSGDARSISEPPN
jgi:hypothetical protein